ncbi:MAG: hypothetical protein ACOYMS_03265 [Terrimicrobiaceae bacterium]
MDSNSSNVSPKLESDPARQRRQRILDIQRAKSGGTSTFAARMRSEVSPASAPVPQEAPSPAGWSEATSAALAPSSRLFALAAIVAVGLLALTLWAGFSIGHWRGKSVAEREIVATRLQTLKRLPATEAEALNQAVAGLRSGKAEASYNTLKDLRAKYPRVASLSYLTALSALETGRYVVAETHVRESIKAGQRVSDSLALLANLESRKSAMAKKKPVEADRKEEELLRAAITADAANPYPHIELANLLRVQGRSEEAQAEFRSAQALLTPVDSHLVVDLALGVMKIEQTPEGEIAAPATTNGDVRTIFPAAYAAMRKGDMALAGSLLEQCRELLPADLFNYLMSDPAVRKFANREELRPFYAQR